MVDVTDATFETDVLERSDHVPVVVDLWAPWCQPCLKLGPVIEQVVADQGGQVELAKVDIDQNPQVQAAFKVQSIPAVFAIYQRQVVSTFQGAQPEPQVRAFVESLLPSEAERELAALVEKGDEASLLTVLERVPGDPEATVKLAELYAGEGRGEEALTALAKVPESPETRRVAALARTGASASAPVDDPDSPLFGVEAKLDDLLERVKDDDEARVAYLDLLELLGPDDPRTAPYRKALSRKLF